MNIRRYCHQKEHLLLDLVFFQLLKDGFLLRENCIVGFPPVLLQQLWLFNNYKLRDLVLLPP